MFARTTGTSCDYTVSVSVDWHAAAGLKGKNFNISIGGDQLQPPNGPDGDPNGVWTSSGLSNNNVAGRSDLYSPVDVQERRQREWPILRWFRRARRARSVPLPGDQHQGAPALPRSNVELGSTFGRSTRRRAAVVPGWKHRAEDHDSTRRSDCSRRSTPACAACCATTTRVPAKPSRATLRIRARSSIHTEMAASRGTRTTTIQVPHGGYRLPPARAPTRTGSRPQVEQPREHLGNASSTRRAPNQTSSAMASPRRSATQRERAHPEQRVQPVQLHQQELLRPEQAEPVGARNRGPPVHRVVLLFIVPYGAYKGIGSQDGIPIERFRRLLCHWVEGQWRLRPESLRRRRSRRPCRPDSA